MLEVSCRTRLTAAAAAAASASASACSVCAAHPPRLRDDWVGGSGFCTPPVRAGLGRVGLCFTGADSLGRGGSTGCTGQSPARRGPGVKHASAACTDIDPAAKAAGGCGCGCGRQRGVPHRRSLGRQGLAPAQGPGRSARLHPVLRTLWATLAASDGRAHGDSLLARRAAQRLSTSRRCGLAEESPPSMDGG